MSEDKRPLFPLELVLLPDERIPLHIFELRYQSMLRRCLDENKPFGVIFLKGGKLARVGCAAHVETVLRRFEDGRCHILVRGGERFSVRDAKQHDDGYLEGVWVPHEDETSGDPEPPERDRHSLASLFREYRRLQQELPDPEPSLSDELPFDESEEGLAFRVGARCRLPIEQRQKVLAATSERERVDVLMEHLVRSVTQLRQKKDNLDTIRTNGHIHRGA